MSDILGLSWDYDGWIVLAGMLCAVAASLPGNFLLLRRMSLLWPEAEDRRPSRSRRDRRRSGH